MKVYIDRDNMKLLGVEKERPFFTGDVFSSKLNVYFNSDVSSSSVTMSFLLANGRTPRKNLISDSSRIVTFEEEKFGYNNWYEYSWDLSAKEGLLVAPGPIQMTLSLTTNNTVEQVNFTNNVVRTNKFGSNENIYILGENEEEIILDFATNIDTLQHKFTFIGEFETKASMYEAAFNDIYLNNHSIITARYNDNVFIFIRSDSQNEEELMMIDASNYESYKLNINGTLTPTSSNFDHSALYNLDYEHSGHTGFMPSRLSILPEINQNDSNERLTLSVYDSNSDSAKKINFSNFAARIIRTSNTQMPNDIQKGQYVFLEINNN